MSTYDKAFRESLEYFGGDELAANVFITKYALTDKKGQIHELSPDEMHHRMAREFARIEAKYPNAMAKDEKISSTLCLKVHQCQVLETRTKFSLFQIVL